jgi:dihydropteroate synthase
LSLSTSLRKTFTVHARDRRLVLGPKTAVMGVVNVTPDSFSNDGRVRRSAAANAAYALKLVREGADIIDIGGESTRPGAKPVPVSDEIKRVVPVVRLLRKRSPVFISVDTYKPEVAASALDARADIINNVQPAALTKPFLDLIKEYDAALILMHSRGNSRTMQRRTKYKNFLPDILAELRISLEKCLSAGIKSDRIIVDPGIGFAKTAEQNLELLKDLRQFRTLGRPILVGTSRKSFIGKVLGADVAHRLWGTAATVAVSVVNGAHVVRVHDVAAMRQTVDMTDAILTSSHRTNA